MHQRWLGANGDDLPPRHLHRRRRRSRLRRHLPAAPAAIYRSLQPPASHPLLRRLPATIRRVSPRLANETIGRPAALDETQSRTANLHSRPSDYVHASVYVRT